MRDILVFIIVFGSLPFILRRPVIGALMWVWISVMNPHTQGWGFATHFPFAQIVALSTMCGMLFSQAPKSMPWSAPTLSLLLFVLWMNITLPFSIFFTESLDQWEKVMKIMLMSFVVIMLIKTREDIDRLMWVLAISLGFYGVKGGLFTLRSGGSERVWGPEDTFIGDNNAIALALIMCIPIMRYVQLRTTRRSLRHGLTLAMLLSALAALGSYSRGGLLAIGAMAAFMWLKSPNKAKMGGVMVLSAPLLLLFMPEQWGTRMDSINEYQLDSSAMGRLNAWQMAYRLAKERFFGGGFEVYEPSVFLAYAPDPSDIHAAHSIYFQILGEHGFPGLALYLFVGICTWRCASDICRRTIAADWQYQLATMIQTSLVGFAVGGAFLSLAYFDMPYYLLSAVVSTHALLPIAKKEMR